MFNVSLHICLFYNDDFDHSYIFIYNIITQLIYLFELKIYLKKRNIYFF